ncbi:MBL fold metallo-hydrolase [Pollutibacter soli]|uniref:MBL fold metallo-hydrolase n=1 Tax=Pollutibacter soli TaxID=3034157 RepID=UPI003013705A
MKIEQIYTGCLAQGAYYIESDGEAAVIDPLREVEPYIKKAERNHAVIKWVLETHFHADFVSGHLDLSKKTGAPIVYGPTATPSFDAHIAKDGEILKLGKTKIKVLHTPGHTLESSCYLLFNEDEKPVALFSGDTLFIGDVGRPDLAQKAASMTKEELAGLLFDSLRSKVMPLPDDIIVYPAHGAGSACGKNMSKETSDLLGHQKKTNYALRADMTREQFINEVTEGLQPPPAYFPLNVMLNKQGYESIDEVMKRGNIAMSPDAFETAANETGAIILDTRDAERFSAAFIPNSINIGLDGTFAPWVGALIPDIKQPILIVDEPGREEEVITRLARVGYDHTIGYLKGGIRSWIEAAKETDRIENIDPEDFAKLLKKEPGTHVLDVRNPTEFNQAHLKNAQNHPLDYISEQMHELDKDKTYYAHCAGGYRSMVFASILKSRGFDHIINIKGGFKKLEENGKFHITTKAEQEAG